MYYRCPESGSKLPPAVAQEVFEIVMDTQDMVRHPSADAEAPSVLLLGNDEQLKRSYVEATAAALGTVSHRLPVMTCVGREDEMAQAFENVARRGGIVFLEGLHHLAEGRNAGVRAELIELLARQRIGDKPFVIVGSGHSEVLEDEELAAAFERRGVLSYRGLAKVNVEPALAMAGM